jgi:hypothetical protein
MPISNERSNEICINFAQNLSKLTEQNILANVAPNRAEWENVIKRAAAATAETFSITAQEVYDLTNMHPVTS